MASGIPDNIASLISRKHGFVFIEILQCLYENCKNCWKRMNRMDNLTADGQSCFMVEAEHKYNHIRRPEAEEAPDEGGR